MQFTLTDVCGGVSQPEVLTWATVLAISMVPLLLWHLRRRPEAGLLLAAGPHGDVLVATRRVTGDSSFAAVALSPRLFQGARSTASGLDLLLTAHVLFGALLARHVFQVTQVPTLPVAACSLAVATLAAWVRPHRAWLHVLHAAIFLLAIEFLSRFLG